MRAKTLYRAALCVHGCVCIKMRRYTHLITPIDKSVLINIGIVNQRKAKSWHDEIVIYIIMLCYLLELEKYLNIS